jgi:hypothetical protein
MPSRLKAVIGLSMCVGLGVASWFAFGAGKSEAG